MLKRLGALITALGFFGIPLDIFAARDAILTGVGFLNHGRVRTGLVILGVGLIAFDMLADRVETIAEAFARLRIKVAGLVSVDEFSEDISRSNQMERSDSLVNASRQVLEKSYVSCELFDFIRAGLLEAFFWPNQTGHLLSIDSHVRFAVDLNREDTVARLAAQTYVSKRKASGLRKRTKAIKARFS